MSTGNRFAVFLFFGCGVLEKCLGLFRNWCPDMIFGISRLVSDFCLEINHLYHKHVPLLCCQEIGKDFSMSLIISLNAFFKEVLYAVFAFDKNFRRSLGSICFFSFYFSLFSSLEESISFIHHVKLEKRRLTSIYSKSACCVIELCIRICKMNLQKSIIIIFPILCSVLEE